MSSNFDMIATVDITIASPAANEASFGNLLILGPGPTGTPNGPRAIPDVGVYGSITEVQDAGFIVSGDNADPVGVAASVAFSQSPAPTEVYIAIQKPAAGSAGAAQTIADVKDVCAPVIGQKEGMTGCELFYAPDNRRVYMNLTGPVTGVKNTGLVEAMTALVAKGYTVSVNGTEVKDIKAVKALPAFADIAAMQKDGPAIEMLVEVSHEDALDVAYGITVTYATDWVQPTPEAPIDDPAEALESPVDAAARAMDVNGWYALCTAGVDSKYYEEIAAYIEGTEKMFAYTELGFFGAGKDGSDAPSVGNVYFRTLGVYGRENTAQADEDIPKANLYINVAMAAAWLFYQPGSETAAFKKLAAVYPSDLKKSEMKALEDAHLNYFVSVGGKNVTMNGQVMGNEWADIIRFRDWLKSEMQTNVANLFLTNPKVPFTDGGIALIENQMIATLKLGQQVGGIAEEEFDEDGNAIPGYTTTVPLSASLSASEKASRKLPRCSFVGRLAGAIHNVPLTGTLTYDNL